MYVEQRVPGCQSIEQLQPIRTSHNIMCEKPEEWPPCLIHIVLKIFLNAAVSQLVGALSPVRMQQSSKEEEMRCYRKILRTSCKDNVTNEEVHAKIQQAVRPHDDLLTIVKRRKLQC